MMGARLSILGVPVDAVSMEDAVDIAEAWILNGTEAKMILAVNPEKVIAAQLDDSILSSLRAAALLIPDGIGVCWAARILGMGKVRRVPGSELMPALCERAARESYRVFVFGAKPSSCETAVANLCKQYPNLCIAGYQHGYIKDDENEQLLRRINSSGAQLLFVGLGSPKQELWLRRNMPRLQTVRVCQGVGGTLDVLAGTVRRAPLFFRRLYLEWFYRLMSQPHRLLRQRALPRFAWQVMRAMLLR